VPCDGSSCLSPAEGSGEARARGRARARASCARCLALANLRAASLPCSVRESPRPAPPPILPPAEVPYDSDVPPRFAVHAVERAEGDARSRVLTERASTRSRGEALGASRSRNGHNIESLRPTRARCRVLVERSHTSSRCGRRTLDVTCSWNGHAHRVAAADARSTPRARGTVTHIESLRPTRSCRVPAERPCTPSRNGTERTHGTPAGGRIGGGAGRGLSRTEHDRDVARRFARARGARRMRAPERVLVPRLPRSFRRADPRTAVTRHEASLPPGRGTNRRHTARGEPSRPTCKIARCRPTCTDERATPRRPPS